jgi:ADP-dependent NAD(P)H-hydrate dehydratase / NAD(P)H-hydrate epimerase
MYAAKMSGQAPSYDVFTPDMGELAFLADESAPHPFYTRGFILHEENRAPELIKRAYQHENAAISSGQGRMRR